MEASQSSQPVGPFGPFGPAGDVEGIGFLSCCQDEMGDVNKVGSLPCHLGLSRPTIHRSLFHSLTLPCVVIRSSHLRLYL